MIDFCRFSEMLKNSEGSLCPPPFHPKKRFMQFKLFFFITTYINDGQMYGSLKIQLLKIINRFFWKILKIMQIFFKNMHISNIYLY